MPLYKEEKIKTSLTLPDKTERDEITGMFTTLGLSPHRAIGILMQLPSGEHEPIIETQINPDTAGIQISPIYIPPIGLDKIIIPPTYIVGNTSFNVTRGYHILLCNAYSGDINVNLGNPSRMQGCIVIVKRIDDNGSNSVIVRASDGRGIFLIDQRFTTRMINPYACEIYFSSGIDWFIIGMWGGQ